MLIVWDKLFRSFEPEVERPIYGLSKNIETYNPVPVAFHEWAAWAADLRRSRSVNEVFGYTFRAPGWQPSTSGRPAGGAGATAIPRPQPVEQTA